MKLKNLGIGIVLLFATYANAQSNYEDHLIEVTLHEQDTLKMNFVKTPDLFQERWDTLAQPSFWKFVMKMSPQTSILNVAKTRQVLELQPLSEWNKQTDDENLDGKNDLGNRRNQKQTFFYYKKIEDGSEFRKNSFSSEF